MCRIAIVDDNETWCFVLALRLQQQGYTVTPFTHARAFLREMDQFDLVLVDFSMPAPAYQVSMDGPELICQVKQQLDTPPLLVLTSSFFTQDLLGQASDLCPEADAVLIKQADLTEMLAQIQQLLASRMPSRKKDYSAHRAGSSAEAEDSIHG